MSEIHALISKVHSFRGYNTSCLLSDTDLSNIKTICSVLNNIPNFNLKKLSISRGIVEPDLHFNYQHVHNLHIYFRLQPNFNLSVTKNLLESEYFKTFDNIKDLCDNISDTVQLLIN